MTEPDRNVWLLTRGGHPIAILETAQPGWLAADLKGASRRGQAAIRMPLADALIVLWADK